MNDVSGVILWHAGEQTDDKIFVYISDNYQKIEHIGLNLEVAIDDLIANPIFHEIKKNCNA